eukprot:gnl/TRDRNA2_/TRDRNA2_177155_c1_seq4.p1 gnl/TRDRNA2_/TRDRNA2_177155_c1~~gnl/TRDRNA2_/TRDRNA2_177155_c1_seq4.p1  ORF type:complete len:796 (-),score=86.48 gnl/TRDRNA2_/TRDRNA2_177155_c1_seq4:243-2630(-)
MPSSPTTRNARKTKCYCGVLPCMLLPMAYLVYLQLWPMWDSRGTGRLAAFLGQTTETSPDELVPAPAPPAILAEHSQKTVPSVAPMRIAVPTTIQAGREETSIAVATTTTVATEAVTTAETTTTLIQTSAEMAATTTFVASSMPASTTALLRRADGKRQFDGCVPPVCKPPPDAPSVSISEVPLNSQVATLLSSLAPHVSPRLYVISVTGEPQVERAVLMQPILERSLGPEDEVFHICGPRCEKLAAGKLRNLVVMPDSAFPGGKCHHLNGEECSGYKRASLKYPYALVHLVRELKRLGRPLPKWWLLKDTDTYVGSVPLVVKSVEGYDPSLPVMFAQMAGSPQGGGGLLFSSALAEELAMVFGDRMLTYMVEHIIDGTFYWDEHTVTFAKYWVSGGTGQVKENHVLQAFSPHQEICMLPDKGPERLYENMPDCHIIPNVCLCARSPMPATWHFLYNNRPWEESIQLLDSFYSGTLSASTSSPGTSSSQSGTGISSQTSDVPANAAVASIVASLAQQSTPRLYVISAAGEPQVEQAVMMQRTLERSLGPEDAVFHVCGPRCEKAAAGRLRNLIVMPDSAFPGSRCVHPNGQECSGYKRASLKYPYALTNLVREMKQAGRPLPQWWLLKDTDTFVGSVPLLMTATDGIDPSKERVMLAHMAGSPQGGGGLLFSSVLAEELAIAHGERMLAYMVDKITSDGHFYWDGNVATFVKDWAGGKVLDSGLLQTHSPLQKRFCQPDQGWSPGPECYEIPKLCLCARSVRPATWHFRDNPGPWEEPVRLLESFYDENSAGKDL